jgi:negative regulator of replication initiation
MSGLVNRNEFTLEELARILAEATFLITSTKYFFLFESDLLEAIKYAQRDKLLPYGERLTFEDVINWLAELQTITWLPKKTVIGKKRGSLKSKLNEKLEETSSPVLQRIADLSVDSIVKQVNFNTPSSWQKYIDKKVQEREELVLNSQPLIKKKKRFSKEEKEIQLSPKIREKVEAIQRVFIDPTFQDQLKRKRDRLRSNEILEVIEEIDRELYKEAGKARMRRLVTKFASEMYGSKDLGGAGGSDPASRSSSVVSLLKKHFQALNLST